jgi:hypothetical protein
MDMTHRGYAIAMRPPRPLPKLPTCSYCSIAAACRLQPPPSHIAHGRVMSGIIGLAAVVAAALLLARLAGE